MITRRWGAGLGLTLVLALGEPRPGSATPAPAVPIATPAVPSAAKRIDGQASDAFLLESGGGSDRRLEVVIDRCHGPAPADPQLLAGCPMRVRLVVAGTVVDSAIFGAAACGAPSSERGWPSPPGVSTRATYWSTSGPSCAVGVLAQSLAVAPERLGALVAQVQGVERTVRRHWLFVDGGDRLRLAWSSDQEGETDLAAVRVSAVEGWTDDVGVVQLVPVPGDPRLASRVIARRLRFNPVTTGVTSYDLPDPDRSLYLVYAGPFGTAAAAAAAGSPTCAIPAAVLPGTLFPGLGLRGYVRGEVLAAADEAQNALARIRSGQCPPALAPKVIAYAPKVEYQARKPAGPPQP